MSRDIDEIQREINTTREHVDEMLTALQHKLSPGELIEEAMSYFRTNPGEAGRYVSNAVREHPVSVTMAGIGIGLLAFAAARACSRSESHDSQDHRSYPRYGSYTQGSSSFGEPAGGPADNDAFDTRGDLYPDIRGNDGGRSRHRGARGYGEAVSERATRGYEQARRGVADGYRATRSGVREGYRTARDATDDAAHYVSRQARRAGSTAGDFVRDEPLMVGAIGLAIGAILGAVLPMTRRENDTIGRESDSFRDRVKDAARDGYRRAEHVVEATYESAKDEAKRQGFSSDGVRAAADEVEKRATSVYNAATETAKEEAERETSSIRPTASATAPTGAGTTGPKGPSASKT